MIDPTPIRRRPRCSVDDLDRPLEFVGRAELNDFRAGVEHGGVAGRGVIRVAGFEGLVAVVVLDLTLPLIT